MFYAWVKNNAFIGVSECRLLGDDVQNVELSEVLYNDALNTPDKYEWNGKELVECSDYAEKMLFEVRTTVLSRIDSATSMAILAGFEYTVNNETLHFSYDSFDQQNFADTANGALLALQNIEGVPTSVTWNGYRNHTKEQKGELVRLTLNVSKFLDLYVKGALAHKDTQMELGGKRKAIISNCTTIESIEMYMKSWYGE